MRLRVSSIDNSVTKAMLQDLFEEYGDVTAIKIFRDVNPEGKNCLCFVEMEREKDAFKAIQELNGYVINNRAIQVEVSQEILTRKSPHPKPVALDEEEEEEEEDMMDYDKEEEPEDLVDEDTEDTDYY